MHLLGDPGRAGVAVGDGLGQQSAVGVEQPVVDAPGVNADGFGVTESLQTGQHLAMETRQVPAKVPVLFGHPIGKAVNLPDVDAVAVDEAGDDASARGAEVDRGEDPWGHRQRKKAAATPASTGTNNPVVWLNSSEVSAATAAATCSGSTSRLSKVRWA